MPETQTPPASEIEAMLAGDGEIGRDALKFLETSKAAEAERQAELRRLTSGAPDPEPKPDAADAAEHAAEAEVVDPQGELETREEPAAEEAQAAGLRQADYTRKMQELAEQRRVVEAQAAQFNAKIGQLDGAIAELDAAIAAVRPDPRELARLEATDPGRAALLELQTMKLQEKASAVRAQRAQLAAEQQAARVAHEVESLMTAVPAFRDAETGDFNAALYEQVGRHARKLGLGPDRWGQVVDAPLVRAVYDSMVAAQRQAGAKDVKAKLAAAPRVLKPGGGGASPGGAGRANAAQAEARAAAALAARPNSTEAIAARFLARDQATRGARRGPRVGGA